MIVPVRRETTGEETGNDRKGALRSIRGKAMK